MELVSLLKGSTFLTQNNDCRELISTRVSVETSSVSHINHRITSAAEFAVLELLERVYGLFPRDVGGGIQTYAIFQGFSNLHRRQSAPQYFQHVSAPILLDGRPPSNRHFRNERTKAE